MKAMCYKDVRPGDVVFVNTNWPHKISRVFRQSEDNAEVMLYLEDNEGAFHNEPEAIIGILHRPWPQGKTERDMLHAIDVALIALWLGSTIPEADRRIDLLEAIEAYELGKPMTEEPRRENRSLVDRHMTP